MSIIIWITAIVIYLVFKLWYDGLGKPLSAAEIENFIKLLEQQVADGLSDADIDVLRHFMETDDGKEFLMVNLVQFNPSPIAHPDTGQDISARALLMEYFKPLMKAFLGRAGHPALNTRVVGGYVDAWNTPPNPGWDAAGLIRYRSRRDAMYATMADAQFKEIHPYKVAALQQTFAIPTQKIQGLFVGPRFTVALTLALAASLLQHALG